jgi:hypothetical protein
MPLRNRVHPNGEIHAVPQRGTMLGNRGGKFHRDDQTLGKRRWASRHWICCELHYKNMHHEVMGQGYTSLFFLDEVTALAAGHRPCFFCRRKEAKRFVELSGTTTDQLDRALQFERTSSRHTVLTTVLPNGAVIEVDGAPYAIRNRQLLCWSFAGYDHTIERHSIRYANLLTPPTIIAILAQGYQPRWHPSALQWGLT